MRMIKIVMIIIMMVIIMMIIIIMIIMGSGRVGAGAGWLVGAGYIFGDRGLGFARGQNRNGQHPLRRIWIWNCGRPFLLGGRIADDFSFHPHPQQNREQLQLRQASWAVACTSAVMEKVLAKKHIAQCHGQRKTKEASLHCIVATARTFQARVVLRDLKVGF